MPLRIRDSRKRTRSASRRCLLVALPLIWLAGAGLVVAPPEVDDALRSVLADGLAPGRIAAYRVEQTVAAYLGDGDPSGGDDDVARLQLELDVWRQRCLALEDRQAMLAESMHAENRESSLPYRATEEEPLLIPELLQAHVIGGEEGPLRSRMAKILDRGTVVGIATDDLVLADDAAHLDHGSLSGVGQDMPVFAGRTIVGRIAKVGRWTSTVQLVTDSGFRGYGQIIRNSRQGAVLGAKGVVAGNGDGTCRLELVPVTEPVSVGDQVFTVAGIGNDRQRLHYGRIIAADYEATTGYWSITLKSHRQAESLDAVQILRESLNPTRIADRPEPAPSGESGILQVGGSSDAVSRDRGALAE